jgi:hypothetical protein
MLTLQTKGKQLIYINKNIIKPIFTIHNSG